MKAHLAEIFNFTCDRDPKHWWSSDGIRPDIGQMLLCPYCGHKNVVTEIVNHTVTLPSVEVEATEQKLPTVDEMVGILNIEGDR
ncbi:MULTISPECIES: hypothetical protein [Trichocoleus]|uniref:Uncharacterized protein n=1 Tax=Trichocoleus desertorum GB2-A4 TaxID=2933944 RepID=A0ABV0JCX6_9CYAN|nr:hypothetical protein [Trichocoleus sp. FACHB-46]MBD1864290.1 hypothetical protein [Trichocoleus sp. FACHB-46]